MGSIYNVGSLTAVAAHFQVTGSTCVFHDVVEPKTVLGWWFFLIVSFGVSEMELFFLFLGLNVIFGDLFGLKFRKVDIFLPVSEEGDFTFSFFLIPFRVVNDHVDLVAIH